MAEWHPCHLALSGLYLYVLESEVARTYQRCCRLVHQFFFLYIILVHSDVGSWLLNSTIILRANMSLLCAYIIEFRLILSKRITKISSINCITQSVRVSIYMLKVWLFWSTCNLLTYQLNIQFL